MSDFPRILERDTPIIDWASKQGWATTETVPGSVTAYVKNSGLLNADFGTVASESLTGTITANRATCVGVHLAGPESGVEYTPYAISCVAIAEDDDVRPYLLMGESPASISSAAAGDLISEVHYLGFGGAGISGASGIPLEKETTIVIKPNTAGRAICFAVGMLAGAAGAADKRAFVRLTVRRLIAWAPRIIDSRKL